MIIFMSIPLYIALNRFEIINLDGIMLLKMDGDLIDEITREHRNPPPVGAGIEDFSIGKIVLGMTVTKIDLGEKIVVLKQLVLRELPEGP